MRNKSLVMTMLGFLGFCIGCFTLFGNCNNKKSFFHEIQYSPNLIAKEFLTERRASIKKEKTDLINQKKTITDDSTVKAIQERISNDSTLLTKIDEYFLHNSSDSAFRVRAESNLKSSIDLDWLRETKMTYVDSNRNSFNKVPVKFSFYDKDLKEKDLSVEQSDSTIYLSIYNFKNDVDLFTKYPGFGAWGLLILVFCCCFAMTIGFCVNAGSEFSALAANKGCTNTLSYWISFFICLGILVIFVAVLYVTVYDNDSIKDLYFMDGMNNRIQVISVFGYTTAALCFAGMISTASYAKCFNDRIESIKDQAGIQTIINDDIGKMSVLLETEAAVNKKAEIQKMIQEKKVELQFSQTIVANAASDYGELRHFFQKFFYAIALLLALLVFCTGTLYSAVDSLDFIQMLKSDLGFSPARHDFIFLYGALHTLLILLFYLPAQYQMSMYKTSPEQTKQDDEVKKKIWTGLGGQMKKTVDVLVVSAPILAGLAQWLISLLFD